MAVVQYLFVILLAGLSSAISIDDVKTAHRKFLFETYNNPLEAGPLLADVYYKLTFVSKNDLKKSSFYLPKLRETAISFFKIHAVNSFYHVLSKSRDDHFIKQWVAYMHPLRSEWTVAGTNIARDNPFINSFFQHIIDRLVSDSHGDPYPYLKAYNNGTGVCSSFEHPDDVANEVDKRRDTDENLSRFAYLMIAVPKQEGSTVYIPENDIWWAMKMLHETCELFKREQMNSNLKGLLQKLLIPTSIDSPKGTYSYSLFDASQEYGICASFFAKPADFFTLRFPNANFLCFFLNACIYDLSDVYKEFFYNNESNFQLAQEWSSNIGKFANAVEAENVPLNLNPRTNTRLKHLILRLIHTNFPDLTELTYTKEGDICELFVPSGIGIINREMIIRVIEKVAEYKARSDIDSDLIDLSDGLKNMFYLAIVCHHMSKEPIDKSELLASLKAFEQPDQLIIETGENSGIVPQSSIDVNASPQALYVTDQLLDKEAPPEETPQIELLQDSVHPELNLSLGLAPSSVAKIDGFQLPAQSEEKIAEQSRSKQPSLDLSLNL